MDAYERVSADPGGGSASQKRRLAILAAVLLIPAVIMVVSLQSDSAAPSQMAAKATHQAAAPAVSAAAKAKQAALAKRAPGATKLAIQHKVQAIAHKLSALDAEAAEEPAEQTQEPAEEDPAEEDPAEEDSGSGAGEVGAGPGSGSGEAEASESGDGSGSGSGSGSGFFQEAESFMSEEEEAMMHMINMGVQDMEHLVGFGSGDGSGSGEAPSPDYCHDYAAVEACKDEDPESHGVSEECFIRATPHVMQCPECMEVCGEVHGPADVSPECKAIVGAKIHECPPHGFGDAFWHDEEELVHFLEHNPAMEMIGMDAPPNGEEACEGHGFDETQCLAIPCCQWDADEPDGQGCWSAVGQATCMGSPESDNGPVGSGSGSGSGAEDDADGPPAEEGSAEEPPAEAPPAEEPPAETEEEVSGEEEEEAAPAPAE